MERPEPLALWAVKDNLHSLFPQGGALGWVNQGPSAHILSIMNFRFWIATALLAGSWLLGLNYFYPASPWAWAAVVAAAVVLLGTAKNEVRLDRPLEAVALVLLLPAVWFAPWPYRAAPLLIAFGLALRLLPERRRWTDWLAGGAIAAGVALFVQALVLQLYIGQTAQSHDLPWPLPDALAGVARLLGIDAAADGSTVVMHSMRETARLAATWELLLDPATLLFFVGALVVLPLVNFAGLAVELPPQLDDGATDGRGLHGLAALDSRAADFDAGRADLAAGAGGAADGRLSAARANHRPRSPLARDEPHLLAVDAAPAVGRADAAGVAICAAVQENGCHCWLAQQCRQSLLGKPAVAPSSAEGGCATPPR